MALTQLELDWKSASNPQVLVFRPTYQVHQNYFSITEPTDQGKWYTDEQKYQVLLIFPVFSCSIGDHLLNFFKDTANLRGRGRARLAAASPS